ncbi:MAG: hypothetical protein CUN53_00155 [Phototrophicales bacterium]|nr:MAG: hypothetical protein CUN53_00155 [Phototrophicales bacterium]
MRRLVLWANLVLAGVSSQACVGKFLANLLSEENANFKLLEVVPVSNTRILVGFNKPLDYKKGALELGNYSIPGLNPIAVEKGPETNQVYLRLNPDEPYATRMKAQYYTLTVSNIKNIYWDDLLPGAENRSKQFMGARWLKATAKCVGPSGIPTECIATGFNSVTYPSVQVAVAGDYAQGTNYRWRLLVRPSMTVYADWSAITPISSTFNLSSLPTNLYRLEVKVQDEGGAWQPDPQDVTYYDFTIDINSVNNIGLANAPASLTSSTVTAINVVYRNCVSLPDYPNGFAAPCYSPSSPVVDEVPVSYKYRLGTKAGSDPSHCAGTGYTFGAWSASRAANLPIVEVLSTSQCYLIQVIAADNAGNFQCDTSFADNVAGACANPAGPGSGSINDFFATKTWQESRFLLDTTPPVAVLDENTLPPSTTSATSFAVVVKSLALDSSPLDKYRYRVIGTGFSGVWSADKSPGPSGELISGAGLTSGTYRIEIIGKDAAGNYQSTSGLPVQSYWVFTVDTTAPTAVLASRTGTTCNSGKTVSPAPPSGLPANPTNENCVDIQVNNVTYYKYKWVTGSVCGPGGYSAQMTAASDFITTGPSWADGRIFSLCVIGSNNGTLYQGEAETAVTRHTFAYDTTPPKSQIATWVNPAADLTGKSTVVDQLSVSINKLNFSTVQTGTTTTGSAVVTGLSSTTGMLAGMPVTAATGIPTGTKIQSVDSATQITLTQNATASGARSLTIVSEEVQNYKGIITTSSCPTAAAMVADNTTYPITSPQSPLQATGLGTGTIRICFIGRDAAGNWESTVNSVSYTRFAPPAPGDGGGVSDAQYASSITFDWLTGTQIPTGTQKISIRVCKDSACSNALPGMNNGQDICTSAGTCDVTNSFTLNSSCSGLNCIKQANDASYFAQLKVVDSIGQESLFGPVSNGKVVVGQVTGVVRNTFNAPIAGATVRIYRDDDHSCTTQIGADVTSAGDGSFTFSLAGGHPLPIALSAKGYCIRVTSGTLQGTKKFIDSKAGLVTNAGTIYAVDTSGTPGCLLGAVVDGSTGSQLILSNATFSLKDFNNNVVATSPSLDPDGKQFVFPSACLNSWGSAPYNAPTYTHASGVTPGVYTLDVAIPGYYSISETVAVATATTTNVGYLPMVGTFSSGSKQIKVILTWGNVFKDLDLHLVGPASNSFDCQPFNEAAIQNANGSSSKFHVSYQQRYCAETGTVAPQGSTSLAVDDSFEYGPEIINFYDGYVDGTYKVSVFNNDTPRRIGTTTSGSAVVTGLPSTADLAAGMHVRAAAGIPAGTTIASVDSATQITLSANATASGARLLNITRNWNQSRARIDVYAGNHFHGGGGRIATVLSGGTSELRGWRALRLIVSGTTLTVDDTTGTGYADWNYGYSVERSATRASGNNTLTALSTTADLSTGMRIAGPGLPTGSSTTITGLGATTVTMSANATSSGTNTMYFLFNACGGGVINGPSDGLTAGVIPPAGQSPADPNRDCGLYNDGVTAGSGAGPLDW